MKKEYLYEKECRAIIGACYEVQNNLGHGFLEAVYQEALVHEFSQLDIEFEEEKRLNIFYKDIQLNKYYKADFYCFGKIVVELKACEILTDDHLAQVLNYLQATKSQLGLLINFGASKVQVKRVINTYQ